MVRTAIIQILAVVAALLAASRVKQLAPPEFVMPPVAHSNEAPLFASEFLPSSQTFFVHGATLAELPDHDLLAAWYGGTDEIYPDVNIYLSRRDHRTGVWSAPRVLENRATAQQAMHMRVKSVGNPVLSVDANGVRLFYVAVIAGGWSGGTICMKSSADGTTWSPARHLVTSPFLNAGMLVRSAAVAYSDGTIALPIYHELHRKWAALARVDAAGRVVDESRMAPDPFIQPWVVPSSPSSAVSFFRWSSREPGFVYVENTSDAGRTWFGLQQTPLAHRDSAVAAARLDDGSLIAVYNSNPADRRQLALVRTVDGVHWSKPYLLENDPRPHYDGPVRREYSYPFLIATADGRLHVVYTWQRKLIRHTTLNAAWVKSALR